MPRHVSHDDRAPCGIRSAVTRRPESGREFKKKKKKNASLTFFTFDFIFIAAFHQTRDGADGRRVGTVAQSFLDQPVAFNQINEFNTEI